jgi:hypothetical protein
MADTITKVFDYFSDADNARKALLASGFPSSHIHLRVKSDQAGVPEGQFAAGDTSNQAIQGVFQLLSGDKHDAREHSQRHQSSRQGMYQLGVDIDDPQQFEHATVIIQRFGGSNMAPP